MPFRLEKGQQVASVVSLRKFANSVSGPIVGFVGMEQEYPAKPRLLTTSGIDRALDRKDHVRRDGSPEAFIRKSAFPSETAPSARSTERFGPYCNEMAFEPAGPSCYSFEPFAASAQRSRGGTDVLSDDGYRAASRISVYGDVYETSDWIASTLSRKLGNGKNAGG